MKYKQLKLEREEKVLTITINREGKMNALNLEVINELGKAFNEVYENDNIKAVIVTGAGSKAFVAGADIAEFAKFDEEEGRAMAEDGHAVFNKIEHCPVPVVAAVNGFALGGGCELAMACHMRVASESARFGQPEVNLGIIPGYGGTQRLVQLVGKGKAMEILMTGDMISAQEALQWGLVNHVVPKEELLQKSREILEKIMKKAPLAIAGIVEVVNAHFKAHYHGFEREIEVFGECFETIDFKEGTTAFLEKRKAAFEGE